MSRLLTASDPLSHVGPRCLTRASERLWRISMLLVPHNSHTWAILVGLAASLPALKLAFRSLQEAYAPPDRPWFHDDILYETFSHLEPHEAARAGLVCTRWHRNSGRASYSRVVIVSASPSSRTLARTLLTCPHLRRYVQHLTVIHCTPLEPRLYEWIGLLPARSLKTCRYMGLTDVVLALEDMPAVDTAATAEAYGLGFKEVGPHFYLDFINSPESKELHSRGFRVLFPERRNIEPIASLAYEPSFSSAIGQLSATAELDNVDRAYRFVYFYLGDAAHAVPRERVDACLRAVECHLAASNAVGIYLTFRPEGPADAKDKSGEGAPEPSRTSTLRECVCEAPDLQVPPSARSVCAYDFARPPLTLESVTKLVDYVWRQGVEHALPVHSASLILMHVPDLGPFGEPCATCGVSALCVKVTADRPDDIPVRL